ncbi:MAG: patatin-like phospholipase family protein [Sedimenticola sp.]|nr:patatin-like phospholipase family protein [Sedimenticola sp.]
MEEHNKNIEALIKEAREVVGGQLLQVDRIDELARKLIDSDNHYWSRRLLLKVLERLDLNHAQRVRLVQSLALATYKDTSLLQVEAFDKAQAMLAAEFDLATTQDQETLGLVGALYKRRWRLDHRKRWLEQSLHYYRRGFECGVEGDDGYTAINAAYIQDLLAYIEGQPDHSIGLDEGRSLRRRDARLIRNQIITELSDKVPSKQATSTHHYWFLVTLAEAHLGMGEHDRAGQLLEQASGLTAISDWWRKSTVEQLTHLIQIQSDDQVADRLGDSSAWSAVRCLLADTPEKAAETLFTGKVGLALSGGGFRASFYHLGVLAKLAELDMLRHIEVLSCVSGGSIVGAHYYLELRRMMQFASRSEQSTKGGLCDSEITQNDYLNIIETLIADFLDGVQKNIRMRVLANPIANLKMLFLPTYSRTEYLGELYEKHLYSRVKDAPEQTGGSRAPRLLRELIIQPPDEAKDFRPDNVNWRRCNKIPQLVLNATTLNTGHVWQFTVTWMGESPNLINRSIDKSPRLRRLYYQEAPEARYKDFRLGHAVAASSCVPGLFEPIELPQLYPEKNIRLVDGGVFDNQGYASLLEQDCKVMIISDASGQLTADDDPAGGVLGPVLRSNTVMMERIRWSGYEDLHARRRSGLLKGLTYVHLTQGLEGEEVDWKKAEDDTFFQHKEKTTADEGIRKDVQRRLAGIRTDLDSFNDIEALALMNSGYHAMAEMASHLDDFPVVRTTHHNWVFKRLDGAMQTTGSDSHTLTAEKLDRFLRVSHMKFFKVWCLNRGLKAMAIILAGLGLIGVVHWTIERLISDPTMSIMSTAPAQSLINHLTSLLTLQNLVGSLLFLLLGYGLLALFGKRLGKRIMQFLKPRSAMQRVTIGLGIGLIGWLFPRLHLAIFDRIYLKMGRLRDSD